MTFANYDNYVSYITVPGHGEMKCKLESLICNLDYNTCRLKCFENSCYEFWSPKN